MNLDKYREITGPKGPYVILNGKKYSRVIKIDNLLESREL